MDKKIVKKVSEGKSGRHPFRAKVIISSGIKGVGSLLCLAADMEKKGVSKIVRQGEVKGKTRDGRDVKLRYRYGLKIGLDDFKK